MRVLVAAVLLAACTEQEPRHGRASTPAELAAAAHDAEKKARDTEAAATPKATSDVETISDRVKRGAATPDDIKALVAAADKNKAITFAHLKKNAEKYSGEIWRFRGKILEIGEGNGQTRARIALDDYGTKVMWVEAPFTTDFVEDQRVEVLGVLIGGYSYTSQAGWNLTIPAMIAVTIAKPKARRSSDDDIPGLQRLPD